MNKKILDYKIDYKGLYRIKEREYFKIHYLLSNNYDSFTNKFIRSVYNLVKLNKGLSEKQMKVLLKIIKKEVPLDIQKL